MERIAFTLVAGILFAGSAQASSFVALGAMEKPIGPSMVVIGATSASPSVVGIGEGDTVSDEKVAAIGEDTRHPVQFAPMVIRGGIVGNAFAQTVAPASAPQPASKTASVQAPRAPEPTQRSTMPELPAPR